MNLGSIDLLVLVAFLASAVIVGLFVSGRGQGLEGYLLGGRDLPWWAILGSIVATETSTATVLSVPGIAYGPDGMRFLQLAIGYIVGRLVIVRVLLPLYFEGRLLSAYEVLDRRFGPATKQGASLLFLITRNLGDGLRLFLAASVLEQLTGLSFSLSVVIAGAATIAYTFFGGMRSVVWNDCIQLVVYLLGGVATVFVIARSVPGGFGEIFEFAREHDKLQVLDFRWSFNDSFSYPYTFWAGLIGGAVLTIGTHGTDQMMVQRYLSARSQRDAGRALTLSGVVVLVQFALFLFIGVQLAAYYAGHPEVQAAWEVQKSQGTWSTDKVFSDFIINHFPRNSGLVGLLLAAILAAAMSTLSSSLNASASAVVNDFYIPACVKKQSDAHLLAVSQGATMLFGLAQVAIGLAARWLSSAVVTSALTIAGYAAGVLLGVFALGVLTRRASQAGALSGGAAGLAVLLAVQFLLPLWDAKIAWPWFALIGSAVTFAVGWIVSTLAPRPTLLPPSANSAPPLDPT
ncbi:MAG: sodium:solute symporter [Pirellulaceae bacterium]|jgi:SSS family transporter|nr:sodium:solute symporter [Pirellulaceae bacterium]